MASADETAEQRQERYKEILITIIEQHLPTCRIYLFGSRAIGTKREGSDADVAVDCGAKIDRDIVLKISSDIDESDLPIFVDLVDLHNVSPEMRQQILKEGIIWKN